MRTGWDSLLWKEVRQARLTSRILANRCRNYTVVLILMIISAMKTCQSLSDVPSLWMIIHCVTQAVNAHRIS